MTAREMGLIIAKLEAIHEDLQEIKQKNTELDSRLDSVDKTIAYHKGGMAVCIAGLMSFGTYILNLMLKS